MTFVGHDAGAWFGDGKAKGRAARTWLVTTGDAGKTHRFAFSGVNAGPDGKFRLLYRATPADAWRSLAKAEAEPVFDVADVPAGYYALKVAQGGLCIVVR